MMEEGSKVSSDQSAFLQFEKDRLRTPARYLYILLGRKLERG